MAEDATILHQLDVGAVAQAGGTCHGVLRHDGHLPVQSSVSNNDCALHWIEVGRNVLGWVRHIVVLPLPQLLVHHLQAVGIVPQLVITVEADKVPIDDDVLAVLQHNWHFHHLDVEGDHFTQ